MRRFSKTEEVSSAVRYVPEQPLEFTRFNNGVKQYNLRKLNQMPYHLAHSKRYKQLKSEVNQQYTNTKGNSRITRPEINNEIFMKRRLVSQKSQISLFLVRHHRCIEHIF